ncbi:hypothetical protein T265_15483, partial [Opisthorchis viverrini]
MADEDKCRSSALAEVYSYFESAYQQILTICVPEYLFRLDQLRSVVTSGNLTPSVPMFERKSELAELSKQQQNFYAQVVDADDILIET